MQQHLAGRDEARSSGNKLSRGLGWFSVALGAAQLTAPRRLSRLVGIDGGGRAPAVMRLMGARELVTGVGILARPRPAGWLWGRVAGDTLDLTLLAVAPKESRRRTAAAMGAVVGVMGPDVLEAARLTFVDTRATDDGAVAARKAVTVQRPAHEVFAFWRDFENLPRFMEHLESVAVADENRSRWTAKGAAGAAVEWDAEIVEDRPDELISWRSLPGSRVDHAGSVHFAEAPGGRGTEVVVELRYRPPAGTLGATVAKLLGSDPATQLADDLRRFKQVMETGEIVRSDGSPGGHRLGDHVRQRPAQPLAREEEVAVR
jgi:uncharacterized membrane protein